MTLKDEINELRNRAELRDLAGGRTIARLIDFIDKAIFALDDYAHNEGDGWEDAAVEVLAELDKEI